MKLASVRALKEELLAVPPAIVESVGARPSFSAFAARRETADRTMAGIALGVAAAGSEFHLAVRQQHSGPLVSAMTDAIRQQARGEVDVRYVGAIVKFAGVTQPAFYRQRQRPLRIGSSVSDVHTGFVSAGTLGCLVVRRQAPHYIAMLSNNHVIAQENGNPLRSPVVQPGTLDRGRHPRDLVGELGRVIRLRRHAANRVDAAYAFLYEDVAWEAGPIGNLGNLQGLGSVVDLPARATVHKVGRTTGQTKGRITAFDVDNVHVEYDMGVLRFDGQIEIEGTGNRAFSDSGDSGSLVVDAELRAIGLLFAGGDEGGSNGKGLTYANPIQTVLDALKVDLEI